MTPTGVPPTSGYYVRIGPIRHPPPDDLAELCHALIERACDAIEHGRAIGFDFTQLLSNSRDKSNALTARIRALRERLGVEPDKTPYPEQPLYPLYNTVLDQMHGEGWRKIELWP